MRVHLTDKIAFMSASQDNAERVFRSCWSLEANNTFAQFTPWTDLCNCLHNGVHLYSHNVSAAVPNHTKKSASRIESGFHFLHAWGEGRTSLDVARLATSGLRVFMAVSASFDMVEDRRMHRSTWMQSPLVCSRGHRFTAGCAMRVGFMVHFAVLPAVHTQRAMLCAEGYDDLVFVQANGIVQKRFRSMLASLKEAPDATHLAKMDMDTFVNPGLLLSEILPLRRRIIYYGIGMPGSALHYDATGFLSRGYWECSQIELLGKCCLPDFRCSSHYGKKGCWMAAQGGLYLMSRELAVHAGPCHACLEGTHKCRHEDQGMGQCVQLALQEVLVNRMHRFSFVPSLGLAYCKPLDMEKPGLQCHNDTAGGAWLRPFYHMYIGSTRQSGLMTRVARMAFGLAGMPRIRDGLLERALT